MAFFHKFHERWRRHDGYLFARDSMVVFVGAGVTSVFYFLFQAIMGRMMGPVEYGKLGALIAILNVLNVPSAVIQYTMARYVAEFAHGRTAEAWLHLVRHGLWKITLPGLLSLAAWCLLAFWLRDQLKAPSVASLAMVGVIAFVCLYSPILNGALQGSRRFGWLAASGLSSGVGRLLLAIVVVVLGGGITAVLGTVAAGVAVSLAVAWWPLRGMHSTAPNEAPDISPARGELVRYFAAVLLGQLALFTLQNADFILAPRFLGDDALAAYGKAALLARAVFYLPLPIATAMFPRAVTSRNPRLLLGPVAFTLALCMAGAAFITLCPRFALHVMYGDKANGPLYAELTRYYVWAVIPLAVINLIAPYLWARQEAARTLWVLPFLPIYLGALSIWHQTPQQMIICLAGGGLATLLVMGLVASHVLSSPPPAAQRPSVDG